MYQTDNIDNSDSVIGQLDGNITLNNSNQPLRKVPSWKNDKFATALNLPTVASYNVRSLFPKIEHFKIDMKERNISVGFVSEVWEKSEDKHHSFEVEKMLEINGLKYISKSRPSNKRGGCVALVIDLRTGCLGLVGKMIRIMDSATSAQMMLRHHYMPSFSVSTTC